MMMTMMTIHLENEHTDDHNDDEEEKEEGNSGYNHKWVPPGASVTHGSDDGIRATLAPEIKAIVNSSRISL